MKKKKIMALLMAMSIAAVSPSMFTSPMIVHAGGGDGSSGSGDSSGTTGSTIPEGTTQTYNYEKVDANDGTITYNYNEVTTNNGTIKFNDGKATVTTNNGTITNNVGNAAVTTNNGTITNNDSAATVTTNSNDGTIGQNYGTIVDNDGTVKRNNSGATVTNNNGTIESNNGGATVTTNCDTIVENYGTVETNTNDGVIEKNKGTVKMNSGTVTSNLGTGTIQNNDGTVESNYGTIEWSNGIVERNDVTGTVTVSASTKDNDVDIETQVKEKVLENLGTVIVKDATNTDNELTRYFGVSMNNDSAEESLYLDSVEQKKTYTYKLLDGYSADGDVLLKADGNYSLSELTDWDTRLTIVDGDKYYVIKEGDQILITGVVQFQGKWYKVTVPAPGGDSEVTVEEVTVEEVTQEEASGTSGSSSVVAPVKRFISNNMNNNMNFNNWSEVATVINNDTAVTAITDDVKLFKLELASNNLVIPADVVNDLSTSKLAGLHFFIGNSDAITFVKSAEPVSYVATDFAHTDTENDVMKIIDFTKSQEIGTTVLLSTKVPVNNAPVVVWKYVNGQYELIGQYESTDTGNVAFPITATGKYALTY